MGLSITPAFQLLPPIPPSSSKDSYIKSVFRI